MINLNAEMIRYFPERVLQLLQLAGETALEMGLRVYLIGGSIRDMLLPHRPFDWDVDLVVEEHNAQELAQILHQKLDGELKLYPEYGTATLLLEKPLALDLATARTETYAAPGANPEVDFSTLHEDLARRDFSINALALDILPQGFGNVIDYFGGMDDLKARRIVALKDNKFIEDPVRSWRACRFAVALGFEIAPETKNWIKAAMESGHFDGFLSDRIRKELKTALSKPDPIPYIQALFELQVWRCLSPVLRLSDELIAILEQIPRQQRLFMDAEQWWVYLMVLLAQLESAEQIEVLQRLPWTQKLEKAWRDLQRLIELSADWSELSPAEVYFHCKGCQPEALWTAISLDAQAPMAQRILDYWQRLKSIQLAITGHTIKEWGVKGPQIGQILHQVLCARLNGMIQTPEEEHHLARKEADKRL